WPPSGVTAQHRFLQADGTLSSASSSGTASYLDIDGDSMLGTHAPDEPLEFVSEPLTAPLRLTGAPRFESEISADAARAGLVLTLLERKADGGQRYLNFGAMSLNHAANLAKGDADITGKTLPVAFNLFPLDNVLAAGSRLVLVVGGQVSTQDVETAGNSDNLQNGGPNLAPSGIGARVTLNLAKTRLTLPANRGGAVETISWLPTPAPTPTAAP
ncbi:MAG TPA: CocE/NonD family hydrolase C-terminal non-catalytic domain-containing protein, partial [Fontimonas sp.]